jgi:hypothetical protein
MTKKNGSVLVACVVFLVVSGWYGSSVLSDLGSWNDWDKPAQVAKLWKAGIFGLVGFLLALGVDIRSLLGPFGSFLPGLPQTPAAPDEAPSSSLAGGAPPKAE